MKAVREQFNRPAATSRNTDRTFLSARSYRLHQMRILCLCLDSSHCSWMDYFDFVLGSRSPSGFHISQLFKVEHHVAAVSLRDSAGDLEPAEVNFHGSPTRISRALFNIYCMKRLHPHGSRAQLFTGEIKAQST